MHVSLNLLLIEVYGIVHEALNRVEHRHPDSSITITMIATRDDSHHGLNLNLTCYLVNNGALFRHTTAKHAHSVHDGTERRMCRLESHALDVRDDNVTEHFFSQAKSWNTDTEQGTDIGHIVSKRLEEECGYEVCGLRCFRVILIFSLLRAVNFFVEFLCNL